MGNKNANGNGKPTPASQDTQPVIVVTGVTGQVGSVVARRLLDNGQTVRAVVRNAEKGTAFFKQGCQVAIADMSQADALTAAFSGAHAVFILLPPIFAPTPGFPEAKAFIAAIKAALTSAKPGKVVALSTIGAQATRPNLLTQLQLMEQSLGQLPMPTAFLRAAWFMENAAWDVKPAQTEGIIPSFLAPLDKPVPMVATADIGRVAAELLQQDWTGRRIIELEGPKRITPNDIASTFSKLLGRPVRAQAVPREKWHSLFTAQGGGNVDPRIQMLDGFNQSWICFESDEQRTQKGTVELETVLRELIANH